jgi:NAD(P)-dependent dehydrogenase (short-subunit alcohol dehydrogenase family)
MTPQGARQVKPGAGVALVTGGAVRLGAMIAEALGRHGMRLAIGYHASAAAARSAVLELRDAGVEAAAFRADLRSPRQAGRLVAKTVRRFGRIDLLVNNAAVFYRTPFAATTPAQYDEALNLNLRGAFFCAQAAMRHMRTGRIINIGDAGADRAWPSYIPYALTKAGIAALTRSLAVTLGPRISVNCVAPGAVLRPAAIPTATWRRLTRGRETSAEDVVTAVVFFATCPRSITGQILAVGDGGPPMTASAREAGLGAGLRRSRSPVR